MVKEWSKLTEKKGRIIERKEIWVLILTLPVNRSVILGKDSPFGSPSLPEFSDRKFVVGINSVMLMSSETEPKNYRSSAFKIISSATGSVLLILHK